MLNHWNRTARRSGGNKPAKIYAPTLMRDELIILAQEEQIRREFGELGVKRFYEALERRGSEEKQAEKQGGGR